MKLHNAILQANIAAVSDALARNPNHVNLLDSAHRTALFCAIVGPEYVSLSIFLQFTQRPP